MNSSFFVFIFGQLVREKQHLAVVHTGDRRVRVAAVLDRETQVAQGERRDIVESLASRLSQSGILLDDSGGIERGHHFENGRLAVFEHGIAGDVRHRGIDTISV